MQHKNTNLTLALRLKSTFLLLAAAMLSLAVLLPTLTSRVNAATLTSRSVTISSSEISQTGVEYAFAFTIPSATEVEGIRIQFCDAPLGTCTAVTGFTAASASFVSQGSWSGGTNFGDGGSADENDCTEATNSAREICFERTDTTSENGARTITIGTITNASVEDTVYARIQLYNDPDFQTGDLVHDGVVAAAMVQQLTVTGRVQERLDFCVAAIGDGGGTDTTLPASVSACTAISEVTVDIGIIDSSSAVSMAPVDNTSSLLGDDEYGIAMINTNASNGTSLTFFAEDPTSVSGGDTHQLKAFRVVPTDCDASSASTTDQCFQSAANGGSGTTLTAGTEWFGVYVPCVDTTQGATATAMTVDADFDGFDDTTASVADCENADKSDNGGLPNIGWNTAGTATDVASRSGVIDDAIVKLSFVASAAATTPTGTYTVVSTYIATPTF